MNKRVLIIIYIIIGILIIFTYMVNYNKNKIDLKIVTNKDIEVYTNIRTSDLVWNKDDVDLLYDYRIDTSKIGSERIKLKYKRKIFKYTKIININIVDTTKPKIFINNLYTYNKGENVDLKNSIICADNYTNKPKCYIEGDYDFNKVGEYKLKYIGIDSSNNKSEKEFTLKIVEPSNNKKDNNKVIPRTKFSDIVSKYKNKNTRIGVDISKWQEEVDFNKLKEAGVEFVIIRAATEVSLDSGIEADPYFEENIKKASEVGLDIGVYYSSKANSVEKAEKEAKYVLDLVKGYDIDIGIAYDWENFPNYNKYEISFHTLNEIASTFLDMVNKKGYRGILYSSTSYLENFWDIEDKYDLWVARYSDNIGYDKKYMMWQLCNNGEVEGIEGNVDIDILYK